MWTFEEGAPQRKPQSWRTQILWFCHGELLLTTSLQKTERLVSLKRTSLERLLPWLTDLIYYIHAQGNLTGQNEFVVYNAYRVMPEYVLHYVHTKGTGHVAPPISNVFPGGFNNATLFPAQILPSRITKKKRKSGGRKKKWHDLTYHNNFCSVTLYFHSIYIILHDCLDNINHSWDSANFYSN